MIQGVITVEDITSIRRVGDIAVTIVDRRTIECRGTGHLSLAHVVAAQRLIEEILATHVRPLDALFDGSAIASFEPGLPMAWIRWSMARNAHPHRVAIVGRPGPMLSVAMTFRYLLPGLRFAMFTNRDDALAFLRDEDR